MLRYKRSWCSLLVLGLGLFNSCVLASGAFFPQFGSLGNEDFNKGKAIYSGRMGPKSCIDCHENFDRSLLMKLEQSISELISNCDLHKPCYETLNNSQRKALDVYFKRRYHLK